MVLLQGDRERLRAREQPLLERLEHEAARHPVGGGGVASPSIGVLLEERVKLDLLLGVVGLERLDAPLGEAARSVPVLLEFRLHASDHHLMQLIGFGHHAAGEPLVVEHLQQRGEAVLVAAVRGGGQEQLVFEVLHHLADRLGAVGLLDVVGRARRRDVVCLVEDQQIAPARQQPAVSPMSRLAEQVHRPGALDVVHADDQAGMVAPRVHVDAALGVGAGA